MNKSLNITAFIALVTLLFLISCRKELLNNDRESVSVSEKFFSYSGKTDKIILRVIDEIKKRNYKKEFVTNFAIKNGFPVWDKTIISYPAAKITSNNISNSNFEEPATDTFAYIPIVPEGSDKVNGFILAKISNGVELLYSLAQDYKAFSFENGGNLNDATKFVITNLLLNKEVFGISEYKITDHRLFFPDSLQEKSIVVQYHLGANECAIISWPTGDYNYYGEPILNSVEICIAPNSVNWPPGGIGINTSGGGGSGGGGGAGIPHYYPCISIPSPLLPGDPPPPCPEPGPGSGWTLAPFDPNNPCDVVDSLIKTQPFSNLLNKLRDSTTNTYEIGYSLTNTLNSTNYHDQYFSGQHEADSLSVDVILNTGVDGVAHNHNNSPARLHNFSYQDIYKLAYYWNIGKINNLSTFSYSVVTDSTSYILMIDDSAAFISFAQTWFDTKKHIEAFGKWLYETHGYAKEGNSISEDERAFLNALQAPPIHGAGLRLFRGNADMTVFTPIHVDANGLVRGNPCN